MFYATCLITVWLCLQVNTTSGQAGSIGFYLNGIAYPNGSTVLRTDVGEGDAALQCITDSTTCCSNNFPERRAGEFYFPNGSVVPIMAMAFSGYYRNRASQLIRLNRQSNGATTGRFQCSIPDAHGKIVDLIINIVDNSSISVLVNSFGDNIAGEAYRLECSASNFGVSDQIIITWLDYRNIEVHSGMVAISNGTTVLRFNPLMSSNAGIYTCKATSGNAVQLKSVNVTVENPTITIDIDNGGVIPMVGSAYSLNCTVTGVDRLTDANITYLWWKDRSAELNQTAEIMSFSSLTISDAGEYECKATITSCFISASITVLSSHPHVISLTYPNIIVQLSDDGTHPKPGFSYSLTCNIIFSGAVDFNFTYAWMKGNIPLSETGSSLSFSSLRLSDAGAYMCEVTASLQHHIISRSNIHTVTLKFPHPDLSITGHFPPYNGTNFNLTGIIEMDLGIIDTNIAITWVWSLGEETLKIHNTTKCCQSTVTFKPLTTYSSGLYNLQVTIQSTSNSMYITESCGSTFYSLTVQPLPPLMPTIEVISWYPSLQDHCGQARVISCIINLVDNLSTLPSISWIGPDGGTLPDIKTNNSLFINRLEKQLRLNGIIPNMYKCVVSISIPGAFIEDLVEETFVTVNTLLPRAVQGLYCNDGLSPSTLFISWREPFEYGDKVFGYRVNVRGLRHRHGTRQVIEYDVTDFNLPKDSLEAFVSEGLAAEVPYIISVKALSLAGCGEKQQVYCFTLEGVPPPPVNVRATQLNATTIGVSWTKYTLIELKGLANYVITYDIIIASRKRGFGGIITVSWRDNRAFITNLHPGAQYVISVRISTSAGISAQVEVYVNLVDESELVLPSSESGSSDPVIIIVVFGVVTIVIVIAVTSITILKLSLKSRQSNTGQKENRSFEPSLLVMNNRERASHLQPVTEQLPLPLAVGTDYTGYTQCPLYDTATAEHGSRNHQSEIHSSQPQSPIAYSSSGEIEEESSL